MPLIAVTPTTVYSTRPIFIPCNGPLLGLGDIPTRIKDPLISDDVANRNARCDNERTYSPLKGAQANSMITEAIEIKEEPGTNSAQTPLTLPVTDQGSTTCMPVEVKTETNDTDGTLGLRQNQDGSTPIEFVNVQNNPASIDFPRRKKNKTCKSKSTVSILHTPRLDKFGNLVPYEEYIPPMPAEWDLSEGMENRPSKKKSTSPSNMSQVREEIFPVTQTPGGEVETYQERRMCPYCGTIYSKRHVMVQHFQKFHKNHYLCKKCNYIYESQDILDEHCEFHKKNPMPYKCNKCEMKYKHQWGLEQHYIRKHSTVEPVAVSNEITGEGDLNCYEESQAKMKTFACLKCDNVYSLLTHLRAHERITHDLKHRRTKEFKCPVCTKSFSAESTYQRHVVAHNQRYTCDLCDKSYKEKHYMRVHMRKHTGEKPYKCKLCSRTYAEVGVLRVHVLTHTGERPYVCNICGKRFTQRSSMMFHHRKHPGNHPPPPPVSLSGLETNLDKL